MSLKCEAYFLEIKAVVRWRIKLPPLREPQCGATHAHAGFGPGSLLGWGDGVGVMPVVISSFITLATCQVSLSQN